MNFFWIFLTIFGIVIILFPEFLAYLIWSFFLFLGLNILIFNFKLQKQFTKNNDKEVFIKIGKYKIYK